MRTKSLLTLSVARLLSLLASTQFSGRLTQASSRKAPRSTTAGSSMTKKLLLGVHNMQLTVTKQSTGGIGCIKLCSSTTVVQFRNGGFDG